MADHPDQPATSTPQHGARDHSTLHDAWVAAEPIMKELDKLDPIMAAAY